MMICNWKKVKYNSKIRKKYNSWKNICQKFKNQARKMKI